MEPWWQNESVTEWITAVGVPAAIGFSAYTIKRAKNSEKHQRLTHIFTMLDDNAHRNARRRIYNHYNEDAHERKQKVLLEMGSKKEDLDRVNAIHRESMEIVKADFNQIGYMVENDAILKNDFLKIYWYEVLKSWYVLYWPDINKTRSDLKDDNYMYGFERLKDLALNYRIKNNLEFGPIKDVIIYPSVIDWGHYVYAPYKDKL